MTPSDKCRRLADAILSSFGDGIAIDSQTQGYIDACLPGMSIEEVAHRICDVPDLDTAPLMDLIFFPDEAFQARLEPLLEAELYGREDEAVVVALLEAGKIQTTLRDPEGRKSSPLRIPTSILAAFVRRLGISRRIPPVLAATIAESHPRKTATRLKVKLRNTRIALTGPPGDFLEAFFLGMVSGAEDFVDCFELTLELLDGQKAETDPFRLLRSKTDALYRARDAARQFDKQLQRSNMETLMHQGVRAPGIGAAEAEKKIALLDRIGRAVALGGCEVRRRHQERSSADGNLEPEDRPLFPG